jgi:hypothetical protein
MQLACRGQFSVDVDMSEQSITHEPDVETRHAHIEFRLGDRDYRLVYEQAFVFAYNLFEQGHLEAAAQLFERLESIEHRGPRAFIMQAFCEAAALHFDECSKPLVKVFDGDNKSLAADLHNAFISYHVGIREEALNSMVDLVNQHRELPTLCLLLGDMLRAAGELQMAKRCWRRAIQRDAPDGPVAAVAARHLHAAMQSKT